MLFSETACQRGRELKLGDPATDFLQKLVCLSQPPAVFKIFKLALSIKQFEILLPKFLPIFFF
jgi:hypothetical protein